MQHALDDRGLRSGTIVARHRGRRRSLGTWGPNGTARARSARRPVRTSRPRTWGRGSSSHRRRSRSSPSWSRSRRRSRGRRRARAAPGFGGDARPPSNRVGPTDPRVGPAPRGISCRNRVVGPDMTDSTTNVPTMTLNDDTADPAARLRRVPGPAGGRRRRRSSRPSRWATATSTPPRCTATRPGSAPRSRPPASPREELWITTKLNNGFHRPDDARRDVRGVAGPARPRPGRPLPHPLAAAHAVRRGLRLHLAHPGRAPRGRRHDVHRCLDSTDVAMSAVAPTSALQSRVSSWPPSAYWLPGRCCAHGGAA